jgi:hypothetical protein
MTHWKPLIVSHGFGFTKIDAPLTAVILMDNLTASKREDMLFDVAHNTCRRAVRGETSAAAAYKVFSAWARSSGLLMPDIDHHLMSDVVAARPRMVS